MDIKEKSRERANLFKGAITKKENKRVPHLLNAYSWKVYDAGYKLSESVNNYEIMKNVIRHLCDTYQADFLADYGDRNPIRVSESLGNMEYMIDDATNAINVRDQCFMESDEYAKLIDNPKKFIWETILPRKFKDLQKKNNSGQFMNFIHEYGDFFTAIDQCISIAENEYGIPNIADFVTTPVYPWTSGYELLFNFFRGIKGLSVDMRRDAKMVQAAIEALEAEFFDPKLEAAKNTVTHGTCPETGADAYVLMLGHTILNGKQFEKFYWPYLEKVSKYLTEYDKLAYFFIEGDSSRLYDFFNQLPDNRCVLHVEQNDIFDMKKKVKCALAGGMPCSLLGNSTPEKCVDYAKKLVDELAYDNGYIFSEDKMVSFADDCRRENLQAVCEYLNA